MKWAAIAAAALVLVASGVSRGVAAEAIKPGRWQFSTQLEAAKPVQPPAPPGALPPASGDATATYTGCIRSETAVPAQFGPQCRLNGAERHGAKFTWSMTCTNRRNKIRSDGVAQYHGDTMEATMVSHLPSTGDAPTDMTQHITGRYLGPCLQAAAMPMTPSHPNAPSDGPDETVPSSSASQGAPLPAAAAIETPRELRLTGRRRYARYRRYRYYPHYRVGWYGSAPYSDGYGPGP